jgi:beta-galactosidase
MTIQRLHRIVRYDASISLPFPCRRWVRLVMLVSLALWLASPGHTSLGQTTGAAPSPSRETLSLDQGWRFHLGDIPHTAFKANSDEAEGGAKGASAWGAAAPKYDDKAWKVLDLPHDWVIEQPFDQRAIKNQGYRQRGIGWYRRQFALDPADWGKHFELRFDGVSTHCTVWFNGWPVARNWDGYSSFYVDVTTMAQYGTALNTIAVRVDADDMEGWWYEGGGIYRHTWLVKRSPVHITTDGVYANPVKSPEGQWTIPVEVTLENSGAASSTANVEVSLIDPGGKPVALDQGKGQASVTLEPWRQTVVKLTIHVASPQLWSVERPALYTVTTKVTSDGKVDEVSTNCGFRTIRFDAQKGFFLNDQPLKVQGVCGHQDQAGVGVAMPDSLWEFRIRKLKEMGANAYRTAHNPPAKEFLDYCDRMGMLVMDENRHFNPSAEYLGQLEWLVRRDRNHPSVILWSIFNEENALQSSEQGREVGRRMVAAIKLLDPTRPVTAAMNGGQLNGNRLNANSVANVLDVVGINYQVDKYDQIRAAYPDKPLLSTEDSSQVSTRGEFSTDRSKYTVSSYDDRYQGWQSTNRSAWAAIAKQPSFAGGFLWTGFDYRGEPTPYGWPAASSYFGSLDLCGFPKTGFHIRQAMWINDKPVLTLSPHWNWPGKEGQPIKVRALTNADTVALSLNGKLIEEKRVDPFEMVDWQVPFAPGRLEAVAKKDGKEVARFAVETTGEPESLRLTPDRAALAGDGEDAMPVTVEALDGQGRPVPTANLPVEFEISGPGAILGVGNGDPTSHEPDKASKRRLFNGLAQVIIQSQRGKSGDLVLRAKAESLKPAQTSVSVKPSPLPPAVPVVK